MIDRRRVLVFLLVSSILIAWVVIFCSRSSNLKVNATEKRKKSVQTEINSMCGDAKAKLSNFGARHPKSNDTSKRREPEKMEWKAVKAAQRDCAAAQALLDPPLPIEIYERDERQACDELKKRQAAFDNRFPTKGSQKDNDAVLQSPEWKDLMSWEQACDTARVNLEEARVDLASPSSANQIGLHKRGP